MIRPLLLTLCFLIGAVAPFLASQGSDVAPSVRSSRATTQAQSAASASVKQAGSEEGRSANKAADVPSGRKPKDPGEKSSRLRIRDAIVCETIEGFDSYKRLRNGELTSDEKLLVYIRPEGHTIVPRGEMYTARFTQDGQVRKKGDKQILRYKQNLLDYEAVDRQPPRLIYLRNTVSLKGLPPGEYEFDITLRDENANRAWTSRTVAFRIVPPRRIDSTDSNPADRSDSKFDSTSESSTQGVSDPKDDDR
jgi:hypothetical protein